MNLQFRRCVCFTAVALLGLNLTACRFKVPSAAEGQHLVDSKIFPDKAPAWIMQSPDKPPVPSADAGFAAQTHSVPQAVIATSQAIPSAATEGLAGDKVNPFGPPAIEQKDKKESTEAPEAAKAPGAASPAKEMSPLERIDKSCAGLEPEVKDALQTLDRAARIGKYEKLTRRCSQSWDLWLWLAKDYESEGKLAEASRCYQKVLTLDNGNELAQSGLANVNQKLNIKRERQNNLPQ